ncbi:hypothetical protein SFC79_10685 [Nocardioides sp. S-58]|uniref:Uncharacterized protein n=1 Tax=Nocardioides renjunii TaxID=3095075 RepID=A0ABU5KBH0_9ACTN|nr:hypothetical protein [Nocardioides sp. S-58]MDZ5662231.1 hypothetical protein [Nocardioides sp. S-58]
MTFFERLTELIPGAQDWYHADGALWMIVSYDDMVDGVMEATWRVDFDGTELVAGRSPAHLNWDDGVRGRDTGMSLQPPTGLVAGVDTVEQAVGIAAEWFNTVSRGRASL